jgi:hypothetical protein
MPSSDAQRVCHPTACYGLSRLRERPILLLFIGHLITFTERGSTTMQCRYEDKIVLVLHLVFDAAFELPVCIVDQNKDAWSSVCMSVKMHTLTQSRSMHLHSISLHEQLRTFFEQMFLDVLQQIPERHLILLLQLDCMFLHLVKQQLEPSTTSSPPGISRSTYPSHPSHPSLT